MILMLSFYCQFSTASSGIIYKSIGDKNEILFSQLPPIDHHFETMPVYYLAPTNKMANACHYLSINLQTLTSGGRIFETDAQGNPRQLSATEIQTKSRHIQDTLREHCHD